MHRMWPMKLTCGSLAIVLSGCVATGSALARLPRPRLPSPRPRPRPPPSRPRRRRVDDRRPRPAIRRRRATSRPPNATELPDGAIPPLDKTGNFVLGPRIRGARDDRPGRRAARPRAHVHDGFERQRDLSRASRGSRHAARARSRPNPAKRIVQSGPAKVHAARRGLHSEASTSPARRRPSSSAPTAPTRCSSPRSTT
jgi:hypothetical protein